MDGTGRLPGVSELAATARVVRIRLRTRFRGIEHREVMLLRGPAGWGEWAPFTEYGPAEAARWLAAAIEAAWEGWPEPVRTVIPVNATVPAVTPEEVPGVLARFDGCRTVKVKVAEPGQRLADDVNRVAAVRDATGASGAAIRVDANGAWTPREALDALRALAPYGLEYAEQPCASVADLTRLRVALAAAGLDVPIAADESIRKAGDPLLVARAGAADLIVVKAAPLGGVRAALRIAAEAGLPAVVSSALDTSAGIRAGVALAAALPQLPFACGLGTAELLAGDVAVPPLVPRGGTLPVAPLAVSGELLDRYAAPPARRDWWHRRLAEARRHLPG